MGNYTLLVGVTSTPASGGSQRMHTETRVRLSCDLPSRLVLLQGHLAAQGMHTPLELAAASMAVADAGGAISGVPITVMNRWGSPPVPSLTGAMRQTCPYRAAQLVLRGGARLAGLAGGSCSLCQGVERSSKATLGGGSSLSSD